MTNGDSPAGERGVHPLFGPPQVSAKTVFTVCASGLAFLAILYVLWRTPITLGIAGVSMLFAVALDRGVVALQRRGLGRGPAVALAMLGLTATFALIGIILIPTLVEQGKELIQEGPALLGWLRKPSLHERLRQWVNVDDALARVQRFAIEKAGALASHALSVVTGLVEIVAAVGTMIFVTLFMLLYGRDVVEALLRQAHSDRLPRYRRVLHNIYLSLGAYLGGLAWICLVGAVATGAFLAIIGVPFYVPLGLARGLAGVVPIVGMIVSTVLLTTVALATAGLWKGIATLVFLLVYQSLENHLLAPYLYRRAVSLNPLLTTLATLGGAELGGIVGAIAAVPALASIHVVLHEVLALRRERMQQVGGTPVPPAG